MTRWKFAHRSGTEFEARLSLAWEINGDPVTDDFLPEEASAAELWDLWVDRYGRDVMPIIWFVRTEDPAGQFEAAPPSLQPQNENLGADQDRGFLAHYTVPVDVETGEQVRWSALPVIDKLWRSGQADTGGFIQEATGWKPSPLQSHADIEILAAAAGLKGPGNRGLKRP